MCSCQYCLMRYRPTSVHVSCVLTILLVKFYYISIYTWSMLILCWASVMTYINPALLILQRKHDRSTPAQCFLNVGPASQTMDKH